MCVHVLHTLCSSNQPASWSASHNHLLVQTRKASKIFLSKQRTVEGKPDLPVSSVGTSSAGKKETGKKPRAPRQPAFLPWALPPCCSPLLAELSWLHIQLVSSGLTSNPFQTVFVHFSVQTHPLIDFVNSAACFSKSYGKLYSLHFVLKLTGEKNGLLFSGLKEFPHWKARTACADRRALPTVCGEKWGVVPHRGAENTSLPKDILTCQ